MVRCDEHPGLSPHNELVVANDAFVAQCMAQLARHMEARDRELTESILTRSERWGLIWRADFTT